MQTLVKWVLSRLISRRRVPLNGHWQSGTGVCGINRMGKESKILFPLLCLEVEGSSKCHRDERKAWEEVESWGQFPAGYWLLLRLTHRICPPMIILIQDLSPLIILIQDLSPHDHSHPTIVNNPQWHRKPCISPYFTSSPPGGWIYYDRRINQNLHHIIKSNQRIKHTFLFITRDLS